MPINGACSAELAYAACAERDLNWVTIGYDQHADDYIPSLGPHLETAWTDGCDLRSIWSVSGEFCPEDGCSNPSDRSHGDPRCSNLVTAYRSGGVIAYGNPGGTAWENADGLENMKALCIERG